MVHPDGNITSIDETNDSPIIFDEIFNETVMEKMYGLGDYKLIVTCISAGDWEPLFNPIGVWPIISDTGNIVDVQINERYLAPPLDEA